MTPPVGLPCPHCGVPITNIGEHFNISPACEAAALQKFEADREAGMERMRTENPSQYAAIQALMGLRPTSGSDPDFDYDRGEPK